MRATKEYRETRDHVQDFLEQRGKIGESAVNLGRNLKDSLKQLVIPNAMIFEQLGILCTAPIDGHDIHALRETLASVLEADGPVLVHVVTKKGHGYAPAEADPETFHGVGPYDIESGALKKKTGGAPSWTSVFGEALLREAEQDPDVVGITAAMKGGTGLPSWARSSRTAASTQASLRRTPWAWQRGLRSVVRSRSWPSTPRSCSAL